MKLTLNHVEEDILTEKALLTINELRALKKFSFKFLVVKVNGVLVKRDQYDTVTVREGDIVEIIHLISGG
jgi:thiamine biosynthesis protein ThiS